MKRKITVLASMALLLTLSLFGSASGAACLHQPAPKGATGKRVAVIIGEGAYANGIPALRNPTNDAQATAKALAAVGFETFVSTDVDGSSLRKCLDEAYAGLANAEVAMFYYSGHGIQIRDENYLVATDAGAGDLVHGFVPVQPIVDVLQSKAKATLVFLDACRNNPMAAASGQPGLSVSTGRGLARLKDAAPAPAAPVVPAATQARGLMVAYATSPNAVARDGTGTLSPFTGAFVKAVGKSGYSIQRVMGDVTKAVGDETDWAQTPWMKSSLTSELKLGGGQTLAEAQAVSDNHASRSQVLLDVEGKKDAAIIEALKGLPASPDTAALAHFAKAYLALYVAVQNHDVTLPLSSGMTRVAVSPQDRVATYKVSMDFRSGQFDLWSTRDRKVVAGPTIYRDLSEFLFSPHGTLLAVTADGVTSVFRASDGSRLFDVTGSGRISKAEFAPNEDRLLVVGDGPNLITIIDVATGRPSMTIKASQLSPAIRNGAGGMSQVSFGGNELICFTLDTSRPGKRAVGAFDLKQRKTTRLSETDGSLSFMTCDPTGTYMVRTFMLGASDAGLEIWDLAHDKVTHVDAPVVSVVGIDPHGKYVSLIATAGAAQGFYSLATGARGHPDTVPDGYVILGSRVRNEKGALVSQDINPNPWRDWPDENLSGPDLVKTALAGLTTAQREEVDRERIGYAVVAGNP